MAGFSVVRGRTSFSALARRGRRVREGPVTVVHLPLPHPPRVAFAVGRPVGSAVVRNRVRRRLRVLWREALQAAAPPPTGDYLILAGPAAAGLELADLRTHLTSALRRVDP